VVVYFEEPRISAGTLRSRGSPARLPFCCQFIPEETSGTPRSPRSTARLPFRCQFIPEETCTVVP
jgi:hypothetical protein